MSGNNYLLDTNIILYLLGGDKVLAGIIGNKTPYISFIFLQQASHRGLVGFNPFPVSPTIFTFR